MITEQYVEFETAKLLKEKGFDGDCIFVFNINSNGILPCSFGTKNSEIDNKNIVTMPTQSLVMRWLREVHNIDICIEPHSYSVVEEKTSSYVFTFWTDDNLNEPWTWKEDVEYQKDYPTYEQAAESAIKYCLENLI